MALIVVSHTIWRGELPDAVGTHWSTPGPADRSTPTATFFASWCSVSAVATVLGATVAIAFRNAKLVTSIALLISGGLSGIAAAQWLISTGLTLQAGDARRAVLGAWILVHLAAWSYGVIPMLIWPRPQRDG
ncbi:hypothetical protein [Plantibacter sp. CFBP 13570]|uniref:hypothetical protein n=1 Tax=Plantibacter sp. CFBP 13570 TaxID=2775272 RepID=UPI001930986A|nr:hypothetical protein [Plantibacter sp. CFBP 13570]MBD8537341.1 hypothetical protein [Plantibacter sp. CFBP 13570]